MRQLSQRTIDWRRAEIERQRQRGAKGVNFTCYQTLEEAEKELDAYEEQENSNPPEGEHRDELPLQEMLYICGHRALGLSEKEALEIDPMYRYELEREY